MPGTEHSIIKLILPYVAAVLVAVGSNYFTTQIMLAETRKDVANNTEANAKLTMDIQTSNAASNAAMQATLNLLRELQLELSRRVSEDDKLSLRLAMIEARTVDRYTKSDAQKDQALVMEKLLGLSEKIQSFREP